MDIFGGRVLFSSAIIIAGLAAGAWFFRSPFYYVIAALCILVMSGILLFSYRRKKAGSYRCLSVSLALLMISAFTVRCAVFYLGTYAGALSFAGEGREVCCVVTGTQYSGSYSSEYTADIYYIDGERLETGALLICEFAASYEAGDVLRIDNATVSDSAGDWSGNVADGYLLCISAEYAGNVFQAGEDDTHGLSYYFSKLNTLLSYRLRTAVGGKEGQLCAAMLLGDTSSLDESVKRDFRRAGISHLLAVSGMHLSLAAAVLSWLLNKLKFERKIRMTVTVLLLAVYLALLGFPVSAVRSVIMLVCVYGGFFSGFGSDGLTALGTALIIVLMSGPAAVCDSGFILSFAATLGIVALSPLYSEFSARYRAKVSKSRHSLVKPGKWERLWQDICIFVLEKLLPPAVTVVAANMMTLLPVSIFFGEISLASPLSNFIFPFMASPLLVLSALTLVFSASPAGGFFAFYAEKLAGFMLRLAAEVSDIRGISVSLSYSFVPFVLIPAALLTGLLLSLRLRRKLLCLTPFFASLLCLALCFAFLVPDSTQLCFASVGNSETLTAVHRGSMVICDISTGGYSCLSSAAKYGAESGATEIEALVLTHLHTAHISAVTRLAKKYRLRHLVIPEPVSSDDAAVALKLYEAAELADTEISTYSPYEELSFYRGITARFSGIYRLERSTQPLVAFELSDGNKQILYLGPSCYENPEIPENFTVGGNTRVVIGTHGPKLKANCLISMNEAAGISFFGLEGAEKWLAGTCKSENGISPPVYYHKEFAVFVLGE